LDRRRVTIRMDRTHRQVVVPTSRSLLLLLLIVRSVRGRLKSHSIYLRESQSTHSATKSAFFFSHPPTALCDIPWGPTYYYHREQESDLFEDRYPIRSFIVPVSTVPTRLLPPNAVPRSLHLKERELRGCIDNP
jgi:hypothetical protein